jgi:hypothetical protein
MNNMDNEKIFILDSEKSFKMAEKFKGSLENKGFRVKTKTYGLNGVRITGVKDMKEYPYRSQAELCYHSPTSGRVACGHPMIHFDPVREKEFTTVRKIGGGTKRLYDWRKHYTRKRK